jgi:hypothetical protein
MDQPVASTNKGPQQKSLQYDTTGKVANNSDSDAYKNADISESDDICETEESDPTVSERIRSSSSTEEVVLQTQQDMHWKRIHRTKSK